MVKKHVWMIGGSLVIGLLLGRLSAPANIALVLDKNEGGGDARNGRSSGRTSDIGDKARTPFARLQLEARNAPPDKIAALLYRALDCPDPNERSLLGFQCIAAMDASNWQSCFAQFAENTRQTGRENKTLWEQCIFRAGQVAGEESMEYFKKAGLQGNQEQSWTALYGWSTNDPAAAKQWLAGLQASDPAQWKRLLPAIAAGSALKDPDQAIQMMNALPEEDRRHCVGHFTWNLVQNSGIDRAIAWMTEVNQEAGAEPNSYSKAVANEVLNKVIWSAGNTGGTKELAARMEQLDPVVKFDDNRLRQAIGSFRSPLGGLDLLKELSDGPVLKDQASSPNLLPQAISNVVRNNPAALAEWIQKNPSVPFLDSAAMEACSQLQGRGMTAEVDRILLALPDDAARTAVKEAIGR